MTTSDSRRTVLRGATVLTLDDALGDFAVADVLVEDGVILEVGLDLPGVDGEVIDLSGKVVLPGLVDTHRHTWQTCLRSIGADWLLFDYFRELRGTIGSEYRPEDVYIANLLGGLESLYGGTTTLLDWSHLMNTPEHADAAVAGLKDSGIRAVFAYGSSNAGFVFPNTLRIDEADAKRVRDRYFSSQDADSLLTMAMALRGPDYSDMAVTTDDFVAARRLGLPITVHVGSNLSYANSVGLLGQADLMGPDVTYVHCNTTTDAELALIRETGGTVSVSPEAEMHLGCGLPPVQRLLNHGLTPSISTDVPTVLGMDMFTQMRILLGVQRGVDAQYALDVPNYVRPERLTTHDVLSYATHTGAVTVGLGDRTGSLTPGKRADLIVVEPATPLLSPFCHPNAGLVLGATANDVEAVMVDGQWRKRDHALVDVDLPSVLARAEASRDYLFEHAGLSVEATLATPTLAP